MLGIHYANCNSHIAIAATSDERYTYDLNNRLLTKIRTEQGQAARTTTFTYDRNGNQLTQTTNGHTQTHTYDAFNRLVSVTRPATADTPAMNATYTYRTGVLRHSKTVNGVTTIHVWDRGNIVLERNASGAVINRFHRGRGHLIRSDHHGFYVFNVRGDVVQRTDANGNVIHSYRFDAFGNQLSQDTVNTNPFRFNAEYYDWETGFIYLRARYLNTATGRFLSEDPFWGIHNMQDSLANRMQSGNLFSFVMNNPIMWIDPTGLFAASVVERECGTIVRTFTRDPSPSHNLGGGSFRQGGYIVTTHTDRDGRVTRGYINQSTGNWAGSYDSGGWSSTPSGVGSSSVSSVTHMINSMTYVPGNGWHILAKKVITTTGQVGRYVLLLPAVQSTLQPVKMHVNQFNKLVQRHGHATVTIFRNAFSQSSFRTNLQVLTRQQPGSNIHAHHVLPKEFERFFQQAGLNIHDPRFDSWIDATTHRKIHSLGYNNAWGAFFNNPANQNPTASQILNHARELSIRFGFRIHF